MNCKDLFMFPIVSMFRAWTIYEIDMKYTWSAYALNLKKDNRFAIKRFLKNMAFPCTQTMILLSLILTI